MSTDISDTETSIKIKPKKQPVEKKKNKVGRPKKKIEVQESDKFGIVTEPEFDPLNEVEFTYNIPGTIKKIYNVFKSIKGQNIQIIFNSDSIIFYTKKNDKTNTHIKVIINANHVGKYYCKTPETTIGITFSNFESVVKSIDSNTSKISFVVGQNSGKLDIIIKETTLETTTKHTRPIIYKFEKLTSEIDTFFNEEDDYKINMTLPAKSFKSITSSINIEDSKTIKIRQYGNTENLTFEYNILNSSTVVKEFSNSSKVNLVSKLEEDELFIIIMNTIYLNCISSFKLDSDITLFMDEQKLFMTKSVLDDGAVEIKTLTPIQTN